MHRKTVARLLALTALPVATSAPASAGTWYMLTPPVARSTRTVDEAAALPAWRPSRPYDSARECEEIRSNWVAAVKRFEGSLRRARALGTRCISAADPRLTPEEPAGAAHDGWYLLAPPQGEGSGRAPLEPGGASPSGAGTSPPAPLAGWRQRGSFDTEAECATAQRREASTVEAQCISVSDRRLAPAAAK
jgi:hypothetical protein